MAVGVTFLKVILNGTKNVLISNFMYDIDRYKLESESENEGRDSYFGRFSYFPFCQEPVHSGFASLPHPVFFLVLVSGF